MPTYQYRCTTCGDELEVVQKFTDPALTECPACTGALRKVYNAVGVVFKGSGFYRTDSRTAPSEGKGDGGGDGAKGEAKTGETTKSGGSEAAPTGGNGSGSTKPGAAKPAASPASKVPAASSSSTGS